MELYHITKVEFLPNILVQGLLVNSGNNGFVKKSYIREYDKKYGMQPIFLTKSFSSVVETDLGTELFLKKFVVLKIQADTLPIEDEYDYLIKNWHLYVTSKQLMLDRLKNSMGNRFICKQNIKPELIHNYNQ